MPRSSPELKYSSGAWDFSYLDTVISGGDFGPIETGSRFYSSVNTPGWPHTPPNFNAHSVSGRKWKSYSSTRNVYGYRARMSNDGPYNDSLTTTNGTQERAKIKAKTAMTDARFNAGVFVGELDKTTALIRHTVRRLIHMRRNLAREVARKFGSIRGDALANGWLELQYGWKPLLNDVYGSAETLSKFQNPEDHIHGQVRKTSKMQIPREFRCSSFVSGWNDLLWTGVLNEESTAAIKFAPDEFLTMLPALGLTNPLAIAWELVPYSFVVDWFIPIGDFLYQLDAGIGVKVEQAWLSTRQETDMKMVAVKNGYNDVFTDLGTWGEGKVWRYTRSTWDPSEIVFPPVKFGLNVSRTLTSLALLRTAFRRPRTLRI